MEIIGEVAAGTRSISGNGERMTRILDRVIVIGLLGAIVVAPWLFGSVEFYARHLLTAWLLVLLFLWNVKATRERQWVVRLTPIHGVLLAFVLVAVVQSLSLGSLLPRPSFSQPEDLSLAEATSLSLDPVTTRRVAVTLATLVGYFFLATQFLTTRRRLLATVIVLILLGFSVALVGVIHTLTSNGKLLWFRDVDAIDVAFGPFVNRNHFAGFIEMILPLPLALIVARGVARDKWILYGFLTVALGTALVLSASRGALVVLAAQLVALLVLSRWMSQQQEPRAGDASRSPAWAGRRFPRPTVRAAAGVVILTAGISLGVVWIGAEPVVSRFSPLSANRDMRSQENEGATAAATDTGESLSRPAIWRTTMRMIRDHALVGVGLGAYPVAYTRYDEATGFYRLEQAHNDYLQIIAEAGVIGLLLLIAFMMAVGRAAAAALATPMVVERSLALGAALGCWGIAVHSLFDFNLQVPANALLFLLLVAILTILGSEKSPAELMRG
jgi:O-antigen ligase